MDAAVFEPAVHLLQLRLEALATNGPAGSLAVDGAVAAQALDVLHALGPGVTDDVVLHRSPLRLVLLDELAAAEEVGEELGNVAVLAVALQGVSAHHRLAEVAEVGVAGGHRGPVEVVARVEVPEGPHHPRAVAVLVHIDGAGGGQLDVVDELLDEQVLDERRHVEQLFYAGIILTLDGLLQLCQLRAHRVNGVMGEALVVGILHADGHAIDLRREVVAGVGTLRGAVVHVERDEYAALVADGHPVLVLLHLLRQLVEALVVAVQEQLDVAGVVGVGQSQVAAHLERKGVHQVGHVAVVG